MTSHENLERSRSQMIRDTRLWCKKSPEGGELEPGFAIQRLENSLCPPSSKWIPF